MRLKDNAPLCYVVGSLCTCLVEQPIFLMDYKKTYDMVPHSGLLEVTELGVAGNVRWLLEGSMGKWRMELAGGEGLGTVDIKRGILRGGILVPSPVRNGHDPPIDDS